MEIYSKGAIDGSCSLWDLKSVNICRKTADCMRLTDQEVGERRFFIFCLVVSILRTGLPLCDAV
jgi:hypothetical protein